MWPSQEQLQETQMSSSPCLARAAAGPHATSPTPEAEHLMSDRKAEVTSQEEGYASTGFPLLQARAPRKEAS